MTRALRGVPLLGLGLLLLIGTQVELGAAPDAVWEGRPEIIDGDTIRIDGERLRFMGMDAPEAGQSCEGPAGSWPCGEAATARLAELIGENLVRCELHDRDRYGRHLGRCYIAGEELGRRLLREGLAVRYGRHPLDIAAELEAMVSGRGIWRSEFAEERTSGGRLRRNPH